MLNFHHRLLLQKRVSKSVFTEIVCHGSWQTVVESCEPRRGSLSASWRLLGPILADALEAAGITNQSPLGPLPLKTVMWVSPGSVGVALGCGSRSRGWRCRDRAGVPCAPTASGPASAL